MPYFRVKHTGSGEVFRAEHLSKTKLKNYLTRFDVVNCQYRSFWDITEVDLNGWNKLKRDEVPLVPGKYISP